MNDIDLKDPSLYINRELSWLEFNARVVANAERDDVPILERLKFVAIAVSNLDEFYMVRVASLHKKHREGGGDSAGFAFVDGKEPVGARLIRTRFKFTLQPKKIALQIQGKAGNFIALAFATTGLAVSEQQVVETDHLRP